MYFKGLNELTFVLGLTFSLLNREISVNVRAFNWTYEIMLFDDKC